MKITIVTFLSMFYLPHLQAKKCTANDTEYAVKKVVEELKKSGDIFDKASKTSPFRDKVKNWNKGEFAEKCEGLYVFVTVALSNIVHVHPKIDGSGFLRGKPLPALRDKRPSSDGPPKDFLKEFMMTARKTASSAEGDWVCYVWSGKQPQSLVEKCSYIKGVRDPKNHRKIFSVGAGYTKGNYSGKASQ